MESEGLRNPVIRLESNGKSRAKQYSNPPERVDKRICIHRLCVLPPQGARLLTTNACAANKNLAVLVELRLSWEAGLTSVPSDRRLQVFCPRTEWGDDFLTNCCGWLCWSTCVRVHTCEQNAGGSATSKSRAYFHANALAAGYFSPAHAVCLTVLSCFCGLNIEHRVRLFAYTRFRLCRLTRVIIVTSQFYVMQVF